jgi:hypothetical protein
LNAKLLEAQSSQIQRYHSLERKFIELEKALKDVKGEYVKYQEENSVNRKMAEKYQALK